MARAKSTAAPETPRINEKYACYRLSVRPSAIHRWGVFAEEFIPRRRKIMEYTGERCNRRETKRRVFEREFNYMFTLNSYWCIDGSTGGSGAEYVNHCCEPNIEARIVKEHILYMSLRDIQPGEELTIDYQDRKSVV